MPRLALRTGFIALLLLLALNAWAAGPVYVRETGTAVALGNDFLERTISIAEGSVGTLGLLNKITGRSMPWAAPNSSCV